MSNNNSNSEENSMSGGQENSTLSMNGGQENSTLSMAGGRRGRKGSRKGSRRMRGGQNIMMGLKDKMAGGQNKMYGGQNKMMGGSMPAVGSHAAVWHGTARKTSGGLTKRDLMKNKHGRIVSRKKHALGKKALKNLVKAGFKAKKGTFKLFRK